MSFRTRVPRYLAGPVLFVAFALCAVAQDAPASYRISPTIANGQKPTSVTFTPPVAKTSKVTFDPPVITATAPSDQNTTWTFTLNKNATGIIKVMVDGTSTATFDTGIECLEALSSTDCALRLEIDVTGVNGSTSQSNSNTTPNFLFKLDYQWARNKDTKGKIEHKLRTLGEKPELSRKQLIAFDVSGVDEEKREKVNVLKTRLVKHDQPGATDAADRFGTHLTFKTGYTQVSTATKLQPTQTGNSTNASGSSSAAAGSSSSSTSSSCPANSPVSTSSSGNSASSPACTAATQQQAFIAELGGTLGWTLGRDSQGTFAEIGLGGRARFQDLVPANQVVQSGGLNYLQLSSQNPHNSSGVYEAVGRFRVGELHHDAPPASSKDTYSNASDLLVFEAGYQNNSGMTQLATDPSIKTRDRFVGRFYLTPELPGPSHTKVLIGMEYTKGVTGGPGTIQIFFGPNLSLPKLLSSLSGKSGNQGQ